jgi:hypothetical protein
MDFDSFRDMLDGDDTAIHNAVIARQPQVWSIREHHYQPQVVAPLHDSTSQRRTGTSLRRTLRPMPSGPSLGANLPRNLELVECTPAAKSPSLITSSSFSTIFRNPNPHSQIGPMLHATYTNPASGTRIRTTYTTWTAGEIYNNINSNSNDISADGRPPHCRTRINTVSDSDGER